VNYCSVCDRELSDDARDCRYCGAPSTAVMGGLRQGDEWESLADDGRGPLLRDDDLDERDRRSAGRETDPRGDDISGSAGAARDPGWDDLVARLDDDDPQRRLYVRERAAGRWARVRRRLRRSK
jgi:hypothetical protein